MTKIGKKMAIIFMALATVITFVSIIGGVETAYAANNSTMTYHTNGGVMDVGNGEVEDPVVEFDNYNVNTRATLDTNSGYLPEPTKEGDTFLGWYQNEDFSGNQIKQAQSWNGIKSNIYEYHLYAKWEGDGSATGKWGTCSWNLDTSGVLTVESGEGADTVDSGSNPMNSYGNSPWGSYTDKIIQIKFIADGDDKVIFPESANHLFANMDNLESVDFSGVDASKCKYMRYFFGHTGNGNKLTSVDLSGLSGAQPLTMESFFLNNKQLTSVTFKNGEDAFDTSMVENFYQCFSGCKALASISFTDMNTSSGTNMSAMFSGCSSLAGSMNLKNWDVRKVTSMSGMFERCSAMTSIALPEEDKGASSKLKSTEGMFAECTNLNSVTGINNWDTSGVDSMKDMYLNCISFEQLGVDGDLPQNTSGVTDMRKMFKGCTNLKTLNLTKFNTGNLVLKIKYSTDTGMEDMFEGCNALATVKLGNDFTFMGATASTEIPTVLTTLPENSVNPSYIDKWWSDSADKWCSNDMIASERSGIADTYVKEHEDSKITTVDIGNIWTWLDPTNRLPFTTEIHDEKDTDDVNFTDKMEILNESWKSLSQTLTPPESGMPIAGETYHYSITIGAKDGWSFGDSFTFIYGGTEYENANVTMSDDKHSVTIEGFIDDITVEELSIADNDITITGISNKTYTGKAITQNIVLKRELMTGDTVTLKKDTDYSLSYKNNSSVGTATVTITGKGNYTGSINKTFKINKAANPLKVSAKSATLKYKKLKKKNQTLTVSKVITTSKKGQGTVTYVKSSGNKKITIDKKTGKVTVKKGLKKGTYKVKIKVNAAGNANYKAGSNAVTSTIKVK